MTLPNGRRSPRIRIGGGSSSAPKSLMASLLSTGAAMLALLLIGDHRGGILPDLLGIGGGGGDPVLVVDAVPLPQERFDQIMGPELLGRVQAAQLRCEPSVVVLTIYSIVHT